MSILNRILPAGRTRRIQSFSLLLVLVTVATYWPVHRHGFINFDDDLYVYDNARVLQGLTWPGVVWAFTSGDAYNWHPLTWLSHMLDVQLFGLNPGPQHLVSVLIHAANAVLLLLVLARLTGAVGRSALVAVLFALHPAHVESVAWIAERKDVLSTLFWLLTMGAYLEYTRQPTGKRYGLTLLCFALGLMSKPMLVTLPFVLLLLDYWPLGRWSASCPQLAAAASSSAPPETSPRDRTLAAAAGWDKPRSGASDANDAATGRQVWRLAIEKWPLFALAAVSCLVTYMIQRQQAVISVERLPLTLRLTNALVSYGRYVGKTVWPADLAIFYPYPDAWPVGLVAAALLTLVAVSVWVWRNAVKQPALPVGWLWYLGTLVPVIGIVQVGSQSMADRYTYVPLIGVFLLIVWAATDFALRWRRGRVILEFMAMALVAGCVILTSKQLAHWRDSQTLFRHALSVTTGNAMAHHTLGNWLADQGSTAEALEHHREAIRLQPTLAPAYNAVGTLLLAQGKSADAEPFLREAIRRQPNNAEAHNNLGLALAGQDQLDAARASYGEALRLAPHYAQAHCNLGGVLLQRGQTDEAIAELRTALGLNPHLAEAHYNLSIALAKQGKMQEAVASRAEAIRLNPNLGNKPNR